MMAKQWIWNASMKHSETPTHQRGKSPALERQC